MTAMNVKTCTRGVWQLAAGQTSRPYADVFLKYGVGLIGCCARGSRRSAPLGSLRASVNGWDLQHARRVRWCKLTQEHTFTPPVFGANPTRCSRTWNEEVLDYADRFLNSPPTHWQTSWPPERIVVKWRCIVVAVFQALSTNAQELPLGHRSEAPRLGAGVEGALEQAKARWKH
jgi:hypothetical protein